ncbi:glycosyltransferase family 4 protein [Vibrio coralliirubri]|uniref:glycosyltransferase family 4 protein n=1 Tax=Vibrio coralliirubri TaxID=1516159 RepID=UPI000678AE1E|nr:glycosyltransferase family 4 protein [Vibrio coralliirubri]
MKISLIFKVVICYLFFIKNTDDNVKSYDVIHSHSFFTDGLLGIILSKRLKVKHIVTVRNTDLNMYLKYFFHLRYIAKFIAKNSHVIFLSQKSFERFKGHVDISFDYTIQGNGIDDFWVSNQISSPKKVTPGKINLLSVGYFDGNKNFGNALNASTYLNKTMNVTHTFVGGNKEDFIEVYGDDFDFSHVEFKGVISDKIVLAKVFKAADIMVLPSYSESFGLVYIEAMSQQCGVVCSIGEGIDGIFSGNEKFINYCFPRDYKSIANAILEIDMTDGVDEVTLDLGRFSWTEVASKLQKLYLNSNK